MKYHLRGARGWGHWRPPGPLLQDPGASQGASANGSLLATGSSCQENSFLTVSSQGKLCEGYSRSETALSEKNKDSPVPGVQSHEEGFSRGQMHTFSSEKSSGRPPALIWANRIPGLDCGVGDECEAPSGGGEFTPRREEDRKGRARQCPC